MTQTNFSNFRDFSKPGMQISNFHDFPWLSETHVSYTIERGGGGGAWGDSYRLQRLTLLVEKTKEWTTKQCT